jgi:hypothetical protein
MFKRCFCKYEFIKLTGAYVKDGMAVAIPFSYCAKGTGWLNILIAGNLP